MSFIPQYSQPANAQTLAAQQTLATQQKQASMFSGGGYTAPDMGGNNTAAQGLANGLTQQIAQQQSQAVNDQRAFAGGRRRLHKKRGKTIRRVKRTHMKKRNKRITKRKHYTKRW